MSSQQSIRSSTPAMSSDTIVTVKSISLGSKNITTKPYEQGCHQGGAGEPVLPRYFLLGRALASQGQSERVGLASRRISPFTTPSASRSVTDTIESACEVALSSVLELDGHDRSSIEIDDYEDDDDDDDMDAQMIRKYRRDLLKDDMGLFLDRLSRMRNDIHDDADSQSSDDEEEEDDDLSHFCY